MRLDPRQERGQHCAAGPDLIGQGQQAERAPSRVALGLAIERLMLPELLEQDHREQGSGRRSRVITWNRGTALAPG
jgi:hypothetical protein